MTIAVDFDNTIALGNYPYIHMLRPNAALIDALKQTHEHGAEIVIVTARGAKDGLSEEEKAKKYEPVIRAWLQTYSVPFSRISFNKEYANLYIDDQTIRPYDWFSSEKSKFTKNIVVLTEGMAIKSSKTAPFEHEWYRYAHRLGFRAPKVLFCNDSCIITERIDHEGKPEALDFIQLLSEFRGHAPLDDHPFSSYIDNVPKDMPGLSDNTQRVVGGLPILSHQSTFFHGDLSTTNVLCSHDGAFMIDPNVKHVFGSYLTDAGKAAFSLIAYEAQFQQAQKIADEFGPEVWHFAVAEGLRVCKYRQEYVSYVNNIADLI